jgi:anti-anti-sigma factor
VDNRTKRPMTNIGIKERRVGGVTILDADGQGRICLRFGASTVPLPKAVQSLLEEGQTHILLNLADVTYIDADGLLELVSTWITVNDNGGQLKMVHLTQKLRDLIANTKVLTLFDVFESESLAVDSFTSCAFATVQ